MATYNVAVILWQWGTPVSLHDRGWYEDYFFNLAYGQAGYWLKQSDGDVVLHGRVFDWVFDSAPERDFSKRGVTAKMVVDAMETDHGADLTHYNSIVAVLGIPKGLSSDGGSTPVHSKEAWHHALVTRVGDPFDFVSHELGHGIVGPPHSFTWTSAFQVIGENPGGYGHRHCIMSAMAYGGNPEAHHDAPAPRGLQREYRAIGPSLNGVAAKARGWIRTHDVVLTPGFVGEFEIRSRQWMGRDETLPPQGIHLTKLDGSTYVAEFYEGLYWDSGLTRPYFILTQDKGGLADFNYPGKHSGTYIDSIPLAPAALGSRSVINTVGSLGLMPLAYDAARHVLRVKVSNKNLSGGVIALAQALKTEPRVVGSGKVTFHPGERFCVSGEWPFDWVENNQTVTIDASHPRMTPGASAIWTIDGIALDEGKDRLPLTKTVMVADPKKLDLSAQLPVEIGYQIESLAVGSRLTLTNRPDDESFSVEVGVTLSTVFAAGSASTTVDFTGKEAKFPPEFAQAWSECMESFLKKKLHDSQHVVVFDPSQIHKVPLEFQDELEGWLGGLAHALDRGKREEFNVAATTLRQRFRLPNAQLYILDRSMRADFPRPTAESKPIAPAAPPMHAQELER